MFRWMPISRRLLITHLVLMCLILFSSFSTSAQVRVEGYVRKDGTHVQPHYRSNPDGNFYNNWSTKGNVNPYTGKEGTRVTPPAPKGSVARRAPPLTPAVIPHSDILSRQKVKAIERAHFWKQRGYTFDTTYMSASTMDQKAKDIEKAKETQDPVRRQKAQMRFDAIAAQVQRESAAARAKQKTVTLPPGTKSGKR